MNTVYALELGGTKAALELAAETLSTFVAHRQRIGTNEAGGILLGRRYHDGHVVIEMATSPTALDRAGTHFFVRSRASAQRIVEESWERSGGEQIYLGEWHTHPVAYPTPSPRDRKMIRNMFKQTRMETDFLVLIIVGQIGNWVGIQDGSGLMKLGEVTALYQEFDSPSH